MLILLLRSTIIGTVTDTIGGSKYKSFRSLYSSLDVLNKTGTENYYSAPVIYSFMEFQTNAFNK